ncbi:MAG: archaellin/type IV pilin N-terminal domain-containing protein [Methanomicrobiales archaeon]
MDNESFTGLEAAMVLIAFVVVAAVFSYVMLGAGFFSTQKSQQVIQAGIAQTSGNIAVKGDIFGIANNDTTNIEQIRFDIGPAIGGQSVDYSRISITWSTNNVTPVKLNFTRSAPVAGEWSILDENSIPDPGDLVNSNKIITFLACPSYPLFPDDFFTLEMLPESGAPMSVSRTIPSGITRSNMLF